MNYQIINPQGFPNWNEQLRQTPGATVFHTAEWSQVLAETYGFKHCHIVSPGKTGFDLLIPLMEVGGRFTGRRAIGLPFSDYSFPLIDQHIDSHQIFQILSGLSEEHGWESIELRGEKDFCLEQQPKIYYYRHVLDLQPTEELFRGFRRNYRRKIRGGIRKGIDTVSGSTRELLRTYYQLHCETRKRQGIPPQPFRFFANLHRRILDRGKGTIIVAQINNKPIAGGVFLHFNKKVIYKYNASNPIAYKTNANYVLMWRALQWCVEQNFQEFCMGRTFAMHNGLRQFKNGWGCREDLLHYYCYKTRQQHFISGNQASYGKSYRLFRQLPLPMLKFAGNLLYRFAA